MAKTIVFHSYKGGTGKSLLTLNTAAQLARMGQHVCILDFDFLGPSMFAVFGVQKCYLNESIYGKKEILDTVIEYKHPNLTAGSLHVAVANPEPDEINKIYQLTVADFRAAFEKTMEARDILEEELKIDYILIDTGPGMRLDSANAIVISDIVNLVMKPTTADLEGTRRLVHAMIKAYASQKRTNIVLNRALDKNWQGDLPIPVADKDYQKLITELNLISKESSIPLLAKVPCICDIARSQADRILVLDYPDHPWCKVIAEIAKKLNSQ